MIDSGGMGGGGKLPNANCEHQTTKRKSQNLPSTNDRFWGGGAVNYQTQIVDTKLPIVIPSTTNTISHVKLKK